MLHEMFQCVALLTLLSAQTQNNGVSGAVANQREPYSSGLVAVIAQPMAVICESGSPTKATPETPPFFADPARDIGRNAILRVLNPGIMATQFGCPYVRKPMDQQRCKHGAADNHLTDPGNIVSEIHSRRGPVPIDGTRQAGIRRNCQNRKSTRLPLTRIMTGTRGAGSPEFPPMTSHARLQWHPRDEMETSETRKEGANETT